MTTGTTPPKSGRCLSKRNIQPDQTKPFEVKVDTSNYAIGTVLMQKDDKNVMHPVAFFLKTMNDVQQNYDVYN